MDLGLLSKYNVPVPRYTSYPTVPFWKEDDTSSVQWMKHVQTAFNKNNEISLYIHLPYCESLCTYCGCNKHITKNHMVEVPYIKAVLKEWNMYLAMLPQKPVLREIHLGGGTPTFFQPRNLAMLINGLKEGGIVPKHHHFSFEAHPSDTTDAHLETLKKIGFNRISIGVQDFDQQVLKVIHRFQTTAQIEHVTHKARALGYESINYDLIYGLPLQTAAHMEENLKQLERFMPDRIALYSYAHIPEVKKAQRAYSEADLPKGEEKLALYNLAKAGLEKLGYVEIGMDHFALKHDELYQSAKSGKLHRNFMGYTPFDTELSIGLGASSISDSWTAYAQNEKTLKGYLERIKAGELPLIKNHFLSEKDLLLRRKILDLICHFEVSWFDKSFDEVKPLLDLFRALEADGLVKVFARQVKVTDLGKSFIRNICAVLDYRYQKAQQKPVFSKAV